VIHFKFHIPSAKKIRLFLALALICLGYSSYAQINLTTHAKGIQCFGDSNGSIEYFFCGPEGEYTVTLDSGESDNFQQNSGSGNWVMDSKGPYTQVLHEIRRQGDALYACGWYQDSLVFDGDTIMSGSTSPRGFAMKLNLQGQLEWITKFDCVLVEPKLMLVIH
jgi:hypothetical protein